MKKLFLSAMVLGMFASVGYAQTTPKDKKPKAKTTEAEVKQAPQSNQVISTDALPAEEKKSEKNCNMTEKKSCGSEKSKKSCCSSKKSS